MRFLAKKVKSARGHHKREGSTVLQFYCQDGKTITAGNLAARNCLFVKHFSLFDISTSSGEEPGVVGPSRRSTGVETRAVLQPRESAHFFGIQGQGPAKNGQPTATSWDWCFLFWVRCPKIVIDVFVMFASN